MSLVSEPAAAGAEPGPVVIAQTLPDGTRLQEYRLTGVVGQGGFGVVYRAEDLALQRQVAIKEYLPAQLAVRLSDGTLRASGERHADTYAAGLDGFLDEARLLARFKHPGLLEVLRFWKQNGTAYLAMPLYPGRTLDRLIEARPGGLDAESMRAILASLLDALETLHMAGCVHRDVSPDNVMVLPHGDAVLLDLGAARRVIGDRVKAVTVMLKGGYAPIEQYADDPAFRIGPWTDVYALGAVLHHAIAGEVPPPAPMRMMRDTRRPLAGRVQGDHDPRLLAAIDAAMALRPEARPSSIAAFRALLQAPPAEREPARDAADAAPVFPARRTAGEAPPDAPGSGRRAAGPDAAADAASRGEPAASGAPRRAAAGSRRPRPEPAASPDGPTAARPSAPPSASPAAREEAGP
ncbi:MAG TPA: serine/threonine-protein kinase, partial [Burkholderiaceae bacterium]|nr:serine/threonine-protein kinase [Burkholderiaceae bacterium]